jgi:hypothetical protein
VSFTSISVTYLLGRALRLLLPSRKRVKSSADWPSVCQSLERGWFGGKVDTCVGDPVAVDTGGRADPLLRRVESVDASEAMAKMIKMGDMESGGRM